MSELLELELWRAVSHPVVLGTEPWCSVRATRALCRLSQMASSLGQAVLLQQQTGSQKRGLRKRPSCPCTHSLHPHSLWFQSGRGSSLNYLLQLFLLLITLHILCPANMWPERRPVWICGVFLFIPTGAPEHMRVLRVSFVDAALGYLPMLGGGEWGLV